MNGLLKKKLTDRRLYYRLDLSEKPLLGFLTNAKGNKRSVKVVNIGGGGLAISSVRITQVGESCTFEVFVGGEKFTLPGRPVSLQIMADGTYQQRVCFDNFRDDIRSRLIRSLQSLNISLQKEALAYEETYFYISDQIPEDFDFEESRIQYGKYTQ